VNALELEDVTKEHPGSPTVVALRSVSLAVPEGDLVAVVGPSGSGKSTLLAIAGTLERPTSGTVRIGGSRVDQLGDPELSAVRAYAIGFVFQQFFLVPTLSTLDNVASGLLYRGIPVAERRRAAGRALQEVGLSHRTTHRPNALSGGECQRVAIARALVGKPAIILADEPTGNVDSVQGAEIVDLLMDLNRAGTTILVVTHNQEVADVMPRTIRLRDGVVESDRRVAS
jgi:putative ABC transport system ATP-binding protein